MKVLEMKSRPLIRASVSFSKLRLFLCLLSQVRLHRCLMCNVCLFLKKGSVVTLISNLFRWRSWRISALSFLFSDGSRWCLSHIVFYRSELVNRTDCYSLHTSDVVIISSNWRNVTLNLVFGFFTHETARSTRVVLCCVLSPRQERSLWTVIVWKTSVWRFFSRGEWTMTECVKQSSRRRERVLMDWIAVFFMLMMSECLSCIVFVRELYFCVWIYTLFSRLLYNTRLKHTCELKLFSVLHVVLKELDYHWSLQPQNTKN